MATSFDLPPPYEENNLPGYATTQCSVRRRANNNHREEVQFILSGGLESYTLGDLILGKLIVCPVNDMAVESIQVCFNLIESYIAPSNKISPKATRKVTISESSIPVDTLEHRTLTTGFEYSFPFSILIPYTLPMGACQKGNHPDTHNMFPPIVDTGVEGAREGYSSGTTIKLVYSLTAVLSNDAEEPREHSKPLTLLPNYPVEEYLGDYRRTCCSRMNIKKDPFHMLGEISVQTNSPIVVGFADDQDTKDLALHLRFLPHRAEHPPAIRRISYKAISSLKITPPSCHPFQPLIENLSARYFDINNVNWEYMEPVYHSKVNIPITLNKQKLTPTFATCLVSREYYIIVEVHVGQKASSTKNVRLCIPMLLISTKEDPHYLP